MSRRPPRLPISAFHLATQIPDHWGAKADLAIRKVVYRALFQHLYIGHDDDDRHRVDGTGDMPSMRRLGRINDRVYDSWETFVAHAQDKMDITQPIKHVSEQERREMESQLEVLHTLRCLVGPVVESLIVMDRIEWIKEQVGETMRVDRVNMFDQSTGSGRNMAIVIEPRLE